jgi:hypothetical protein
MLGGEMSTLEKSFILVRTQNTKYSIEVLSLKEQLKQAQEKNKAADELAEFYEY